VNRIVNESALFHPRHWGWTVTAFVAIVIVGVGDYITGPQITFSVFYLVPVSVAAWLAGTAGAFAASLLAAVVWFSAELAASPPGSNTFVYAWNFCAQLLFLLLVALLLAQLRRMLDRERELSRTDSLTGLPNIRAFREIAGAEIARAERYRQPLSLAFIDVDDFKRVNDSRGHDAGDRLLRLMAEVIRGSLRSSDHVARYGGDEFVVLLPVADQDAARAAVDKLHTVVNQAMIRENWPVTLSIGVVTREPGGASVTVEGMLDRADRLMYKVKSGGKNGAHLATYGPPSASPKPLSAAVEPFA
jgi:diguanylate cyclase (GGDEF)-like protein